MKEPKICEICKDKAAWDSYIIKFGFLGFGNKKIFICEFNNCRRMLDIIYGRYEGWHGRKTIRGKQYFFLKDVFVEQYQKDLSQIRHLVAEEKDKKRRASKEKEETKLQKEKGKEEEKEKLIEKYGKDFGESILEGKPKIGMTIEMNQKIDRRIEIKPQYIDKNENTEKWYYTTYEHVLQRESLGFILTLVFTDGKISDIQDIESNKKSYATSTNEDGIWLDMPKDVLLKACGEPKDKKKTVGRDLVREKWYYGDRETRQGTTAYKWEVRLENGVVSGWAELE